MVSRVKLPKLSRVDFYRFQGADLIAALWGTFDAHLQGSRSRRLSPEQDAVLAWARLQVDVPNGGFVQFFYNHRGDRGVARIAAILDSLEVPRAGDMLRDAVGIYRKHRSRFGTSNPWDGLFGSIDEFDNLDNVFGKVESRAARALDKWIRAHIKRLAAGDDSQPIDPNFSGSIEIKQANGLVGEYLEVTKGKPHGAYRQFFKDGTVKKVVYYKAGKMSGDFWRDGTLKKKETKRGSQTVIEWFYPSGKLQKRFIKDRNGYAAEPVQRFHENGRLAEELHFLNGKEFGPWHKFFDDGSPQLQAEHVNGERLIVHNAWDEQRQQVVTQGTGVYYDDGRSISPSYGVFFESDWPKEIELKNGIRHGKATCWHRGRLWSVTFYDEGEQDGDSTTYWENGRVRSVSKWVRGREIEVKKLPKFDRPEPAVLLSVEANERLYTAWEHVPVGEYPQALNVDEVQAQLEVPDFLREVYGRNLKNVLRSDYEDLNTFNDGITYFLTVGETGEVIDVEARGSGVYSGGCWGVYVPFLEQLRFNPGRVRGRAVECRVVARVDHTFVEGENQ
jgi:antitoxin component YwqK of YwqJK toxin-antitoxin module